ncbi:EpsG family protein [uncultured Mucilaginibacter sp.]|uniref:EpsG family protein n=1 Tax=uncultured Mucilaginibacter sp. TaxID=797541 RepID=UPI00261724BD|nr:EpsG family protein [uncultured Mucilaginibacter sp.]
MWFYSIVFLVLAIFNAYTYFRKFPKIGYVISIVVLIIIAAFRPSSCCADYGTYIEYYNDISNIPFTFLEPTFFAIVWLSNIIFKSPIGIFIIYSMLGVSIKGFALTRLTKYYQVSLILYFGSFFLLEEMTQIRVGVAAAILLLSIPYIQEKKPLKFFPLVFVGFLFHYSLIIFAFFYFLNPAKINKYIYITAIFAVFVATIFGLNFISILQLLKLGFLTQKIETYQMLLEQGMFGGITLLNPLLFLRIAILIFFIINYEALLLRNKYSLTVTKIYAFSIFSFILLSPLPVLAGRVSQLLGVVEILIVPYSIYILKPKYASILLVVFFAIMIMYKQLYYSDLLFGYFK